MDPDNDMLRIFPMLCRWQALPNKQAHQTRRRCAVNATRSDTSLGTAQKSWTVKNPNGEALMTTTALEVVVERALAFHKSVRQMSNGKKQWMWVGMIHCISNP